jgi:hypothetical protein
MLYMQILRGGEYEAFALGHNKIQGVMSRCAKRAESGVQKRCLWLEMEYHMICSNFMV